jgi:hypothetical protein
MVAFAIPNVPRRLFPADGCWHTTDFWRDSLATFIDPKVAAAATAGLLEVFDPDWAAAIPDEPHAPHPFEYWYGLGGGVARLVRLGHCLHLLGSTPPSVRARLLNPAEFDVAEAEVRAAAVFARLGATITWPSDSTTRQVEFVADWAGRRLPVEVEQLGDGKPDERLGATEAAFQQGLSQGLADSLRESPTRLASRAVLAPPVDELEPLMEADDGLARALRLGESYGARWGTLVVGSMGPGRHELPGLVVEILREGQGHHWESNGLAPGAQVDFARLCRDCLRDADQQVAATGLTGVVLLERRWPPTWWQPVIQLVARALVGGRFPSLGAVIMRETDRRPEASRTAEVLHVLPASRWQELPAEFRDQLPAGSHPVDLLPERAQGIDRSRLDDQDGARASTPAARLAEALQLMRLGHRLRWARLQREHPDASVEDLREMMLEWSNA